MGDIERGQVGRSAAEVYDDFFVPALFAEWAEKLVEIAKIQPGQRVLDVACGTGVLAAEAAAKVGPDGAVVGLDANEGMLAVARRKHPALDWRLGRAESLPFEKQEFDAVISQFGLMFFEDKKAAIQEMVRVLKPSGRLAVAVWDSLENTPGYAAVSEMLADLFGQQAADSVRVPYSLGDRNILRRLFDVDGLTELQITTMEGFASFPSIDTWMYTDVNGWTLAGMLDEQQYSRLLAEAEHRLKHFLQEDNSVRFPTPAHMIAGMKRSS